MLSLRASHQIIFRYAFCCNSAEIDAEKHEKKGYFTSPEQNVYMDPPAMKSLVCGK
jgi:hypothetical protein